MQNRSGTNTHAHNRCRIPNGREKQISTITISNTEWRAKIVNHIFFTILLAASYTIRTFKYYRADQPCGTCFMWFFCGECLKASRDFSLFFENTMKMPCCFILSCRLSFSLPLHFRYIWVYKFFTVRSQN